MNNSREQLLFFRTKRGRGGWGGHYSREAIISPKEDDYSRGTINRGTAIIRGNTLFNIKFVIAEAVYLDFVHLFISLISIFTQEHLIKRLVSIETVVLRR